MRTVRLLVFALALIGLVGVIVPGASARDTRSNAASGVLCSDAIDSMTGYGGVPVILGRVGLETMRTRQVARLEGQPFRWWAKSALVVEEGRAPVVISVPSAWRSRAAIAWNNRGADPTSVEHVQSCPGHVWLAYPGGFYAQTRGCIPIDVAVGARHRRVWIGMGSRAGCPQP
jgi:hypothetical protein